MFSETRETTGKNLFEVQSGFCSKLPLIYEYRDESLSLLNVHYSAQEERRFLLRN